MFFFGHIGITAGIVQGINVATRRKVDLRKAMFMGILPDLIDKPVGILYRNVLENHTRLWGHSLIFSICLLIYMRFLRHTRHIWVFWSAFIGHFLLDRLWINDSYALFWPFWPTPRPVSKAILEKWADAFFHPWSIFGECLGLAILVFLVAHYQLYVRDRWMKFRRTGLLLPIRP